MGVSPFPTRRSLRKAARRLAGLPSTEDVGRLSDAIRSLKERTEETLGHKMAQVMITAPTFTQLCRKDIREAAEYVGLTPLMDEFPLHAHDMSAAYAGYGLGLCENYQTWIQCKGEEDAMPKKTTLTVLYTKYVLMAYLNQMQSAVIFDPARPTYMLEWKGWLTRDHQSNPESYAVQWDSIVLKLMQLPLEGSLPVRKVDRVVVMGESAGDENMAWAVRKAMERLDQNESEYEYYSGEAEFVAARGAAEFAWRKQNRA